MMPQLIVRNKASPSGETTPAPIVTKKNGKREKIPEEIQAIEYGEKSSKATWTGRVSSASGKNDYERPFGWWSGKLKKMKSGWIR